MFQFVLAGNPPDCSGLGLARASDLRLATAKPRRHRRLHAFKALVHANLEFFCKKEP